MINLKKIFGIHPPEYNPKFKKLVILGKQIFERNPKALQPYINGLARKVQYANFVESFSSDEHNAPELDVGDFFGFNCCTVYGHPIFVEMETEADIQVDLNKDVVVSSPWTNGRLINTISNIGIDMNNPWKPDSNHYMQTLLPFNISWFRNGYHSGTVGILKQEGVCPANEVFDASKIYNLIHTDGYKFFYTETGKEFSRVRHIEYAAIFELGRLLVVGS